MKYTFDLARKADRNGHTFTTNFRFFPEHIEIMTDIGGPVSGLIVHSIVRTGDDWKDELKQHFKRVERDYEVCENDIPRNINALI